MSVTNATICEAPLCALSFIDYSILLSSFTITPLNSVTKVNIVSITTPLVFSQLEDGFVTTGIDSTFTIVSTLDTVVIYSPSLSNILILSNPNDVIGVFNSDLNSSIQLHPVVVDDNVFEIAVCDHIGLMHFIANAIEVDITSALVFDITEWDSVVSSLELVSEIATNMDDIDCDTPYGRTGDKELDHALVIVSSTVAQLVVEASITQALTIQNTVAWR